MKITWKDCRIESLRESDKMLMKGFKMDFSTHDTYYKRVTPQNPPQLGVVYVKGDLNVWKIKEGYQTALLIGSHYTKHKPFKNLDAVLENYNLK
jgi:hypothetical protein